MWLWLRRVVGTVAGKLAFLIANMGVQLSIYFTVWQGGAVEAPAKLLTTGPNS